MMSEWLIWICFDSTSLFNVYINNFSFSFNVVFKYGPRTKRQGCPLVQLVMSPTAILSYPLQWVEWSFPGKFGSSFVSMFSLYFNLLLMLDEWLGIPSYWAVNCVDRFYVPNSFVAFCVWPLFCWWSSVNPSWTFSSMLFSFSVNLSRTCKNGRSTKWH